MRPGVCAYGALVALGLLSAEPAHAYLTKFCVNLNVTYSDSSNGGSYWELKSGATPERIEDNWTTQSYPRPPRGAAYELWSGSTFLKRGHLDDGFGTAGAGCSDPYIGSITPTALVIKTEGIIQSNDLAAFLPERTVSTLGIALTGVPPTGTHTVTATPPSGNALRVWSGYVAGSYALYRHAGGQTGKNYQLYLCQCSTSGPCAPVGNPPAGCQCLPSPCRTFNTTAYTMDAGHGEIRTSMYNDGGMVNKFILVHEMGHLIAEFITNRVAMGGNCNDSDPTPACADDGGASHLFWSREFDKCAFAEAFADFYSADVWNDHNESNCAFKYFAENSYTSYPDLIDRDGAAFDCAGDDGPDPGTAPDDFTNYQSNEQVAHIQLCAAVEAPPLNYHYRGNELDWLRVFWNLHTDGASPPSFTTIAQWIRDCTDIVSDNAFTRLDACADARGASDPLNLNWDVAKNVHTIDYSGR